MQCGLRGAVFGAESFRCAPGSLGPVYRSKQLGG